MEPPGVLVLGGVLVAPGEHQPQEPHGSGRSGRVDRPGRPRAGRGDGSVVDVLSKRDPPRRVLVLVVDVVVARRRRGRASLQLPVPREVRGPVVAHAVVRAPQRARLAEVEPPPAPVVPPLPRFKAFSERSGAGRAGSVFAPARRPGKVDARVRAGRHLRRVGVRARGRGRGDDDALARDGAFVGVLSGVRPEPRALPRVPEHPERRRVSKMRPSSAAPDVPEHAVRVAGAQKRQQRPEPLARRAAARGVAERALGAYARGKRHGRAVGGHRQGRRRRDARRRKENGVLLRRRVVESR